MTIAHWGWRSPPRQLVSPQNFDIQRAKPFLAQRDARHILAQFVEIYGVAKSKAVSVEHMLVVDLSTWTLNPRARGYARYGTRRRCRCYRRATTRRS